MAPRKTAAPTSKPTVATKAVARKRVATKTAAPTTNVTALPTIQSSSLADLLAEPDLLDTLDGAVEQMTWLKPSDAAMVELCRRYAKTVDDAVSIAEDYAEVAARLWDLAEAADSKPLMARLAAVEKALNITKIVAWVGPLMANTLRDIGGAPGERKGLEADAPVKSKLQQLREAANAEKARSKAT